jgi:hypothetical protein
MRQQQSPGGFQYHPSVPLVIGVALAILLVVVAVYPLEFFSALSIICAGLAIPLTLHLIVYNWVIGNPVDRTVARVTILLWVCTLVAVVCMFSLPPR